MKFLVSALAAPIALSALASASNSFAGSSLYFLHGLSSSDQAYYIDTLASYGAKVIRIWVNGLGAGCVKGSKVVTSLPEFETTLGQYNYATLNALDAVLAQMAAKGMKAIISPHDGNDIHDGSVSGNGCDIYCKTYNTTFYSNSEAKAHYDARIKAILSYKSPSSGKTWGNWSEAILAFDLENEPFQFTSDGANNDPSGWLCGRAATFRANLQTTNIKIATGGIGGDNSKGHTMLPAALQCSNIDLMSVHAYVGDASSWGAILPGFESQAASHNKLVYVEEFGIATNYKSNFNAQTAAINAIKYPWVYWQMIPGDDATESCSSGCCTGYDGFEVGLTSGKGNVQAAIASANQQTTVQDWGFVYSTGGSTGSGGSGSGGSGSGGSGSGGSGGGSGSGSYPADTCTWGCEGWKCSSSSPCQSAYSCVSGTCGKCTWGCGGWSCSASQPCNADYTCVSGVCHHSGSATK